MSDNVMTFQPPMSWTVESKGEGLKRGLVRLSFWRGEYPPPNDATPVMALEFPTLDAEKIGSDLLQAADQE